MRICAVVFAVWSLAAAVAGVTCTARAQTETVTPIHVQPSDVVTPVASYYVSTPARGASQKAQDERPPDPPPTPEPLPPPSAFFPTDVSNPNDVPAVVITQHHPVYVNKAPSHWGNPAALLRDLGDSEIIHLLDQYAGSYADNRYTLGTSYSVGYTIPADHTIRQTDIAAVVHAAALAGGSGSAQMYHLFFPNGVDVCVRAAVCYTPDNPATFTACAWHNQMTFSDIGVVIFTIEPYQNVPGCQTSPDHPVNGVLTDSTDQVLSHEVFEAISDPSVSGWHVWHSVGVGGQEIADLCELSVLGSDGNYYFSGIPVRLGNGNEHVVTAIYSNEIHACTYGEGGPAW